MIRYQLKCPRHHEFEGWFRNSDDYDEQSKAGLLACPTCGSEDVSKAIMAPAIPKRANSKSEAAPAAGAKSIASGSDNARIDAMRNDIIAAAKRARDYVEKNFDYVGEEFPEEARKIHYGEVEERGIFGEATGDEVRELIDEGVDIAPLPETRKKPEVVRRSEKKKLN